MADPQPTTGANIPVEKEWTVQPPTSASNQTPRSPLPDYENVTSATDPITGTPPGSGGGHADKNESGLNNGEDGKKDHGLPGSSWNNKKATEEYDRAMAGLNDKNFSMGECCMICSRCFNSSLCTVVADGCSEYIC